MKHLQHDSPECVRFSPPRFPPRSTLCRTQLWSPWDWTSCGSSAATSTTSHWTCLAVCSRRLPRRRPLCPRQPHRSAQPLTLCRVISISHRLGRRFRNGKGSCVLLLFFLHIHRCLFSLPLRALGSPHTSRTRRLPTCLSCLSPSGSNTSWPD